MEKSEKIVKVGICGKICRQIVLLMFSLVLLIAFPIILLSFIPFYIFRQFVRLEAFLFRKKTLDGLVPSRSCLMAVDDFDNSPDWNVVVPSIYTGHWDLEETRKIVNQKLVNFKNSRGSLAYPELQKYFTKHRGYMFWGWDNKFSINNHVNEYNGKYSDLKYYTEKEVFLICKELLERPFQPGKSPWEFVIVRNIFYDNHNKPEPLTGIIFIISHAMADGYSIENLLINICEYALKEIAPEMIKAKKVERNSMEKLLFNLTFGLRAPYQMSKQLLESFEIQKRAKFANLEMTSRKYHNSLTFKWEIIKEIKSIHKVSFTSVIVSAITGGFRNFFIENNYPLNDIYCAMPFPIKSKDKQSIKNCFTFALVKLPISKKAVDKRLQKVDAHLRQVKRSTVPMCVYGAIPAVGALPAKFIKSICNSPKIFAVISYIPGVGKPSYFDGCELVDTYFLGGLGSKNTRVMMSITNYRNEMRISAAMDKSIVGNDEQVDGFLRNILQEFSIMKSAQIV